MSMNINAVGKRDIIVVHNGSKDVQTIRLFLLQTTTDDSYAIIKSEDKFAKYCELMLIGNVDEVITDEETGEIMIFNNRKEHIEELTKKYNQLIEEGYVFSWFVT